MIPVKLMVDTMRRAKNPNSASIGSAAMSVAAMRPDQSTPVCGVWARKMARATVRTRELSL